MASTAPAHPGQPSAFETATYRKVTWRLAPLLMLCYVVAYLDRVNVGFAKLQMAADLNLSDTVYGLGAGIFFFGYFLFEVPSNIILHKVGARVWIARIMVTWGLISTLTMFVTTPAMFYVMRFLLGVAEAGFFPGVILYLTYWYPAHRRGRMTTFFMTAIALSGVIGGPVSGYILKAFDGSERLGRLAVAVPAGGDSLDPGRPAGAGRARRPHRQGRLAERRGKGPAHAQRAGRGGAQGRPFDRPRAGQPARVADGADLLLLRDGAVRRGLLAADHHQGDRRDRLVHDRPALGDSLRGRGGRHDPDRAQRRPPPRAPLARRAARRAGRARPAAVGGLGAPDRAGDGRPHARDDRHPHHAAAVLEPAHRLPGRHRGGGRHRADQLDRQPGRLPEPVHDRLAQAGHRQQRCGHGDAGRVPACWAACWRCRCRRRW